MQIMALVLHDPDSALVDPTDCGDLDFDGRVRTLDVDYNIGPSEPDYVHWWRGSRDKDEGTYAVSALQVDQLGPYDTAYIRAESLPLGVAYDGVGVVAIMSDNATLAPIDTAFTKRWYFLRNYMLQHWREKSSPVPGSAQVSSLVVTVSWTNTHDGRLIDSTVVFRDGDWRRTVDYLATSFVDTVPDYDTYVYRFKHVAGPVINDDLVSPNSPSSSSLVVTVSPPPSLAVMISGPDYLWEPGIYSWSATVTGGTAPYTYQWWRKPFGGGQEWQLVGTSSGYARKVTYQDMGFNLRVDVTDAAQEAASDTLAVSTHWGYGPMTGGQR
jgi:hypothetical protein